MVVQPGILEREGSRDIPKTTSQQLGAEAVALQLEEREGWLETLGDCGHMEAVDQCPDEGINDEQEEDDRQPLFVDVMCGRTFPLARAMAWCGWEIRVVDKELGSDLTNTEVATEAASAVADSQAYWIALTCGTLSRAREIPLAIGKGKEPRALRS